MRTTLKLAATALAGCALIDPAFAGFFVPPPVPEFDGTGAIAVVTLLAGVGAILFSRSRNR